MEISSSRRNYACDRCARRKQRCDKLLPTCGQCLRSRSACASSERESSVVQISETEVTRKGYVLALRERIAIVKQQLLDKGIPLHGNVEDQVQETHGEGPSSAQTQSTTLPRPLEKGDVNMTSLALSTMAEPRNRDSEFLKHLSMSRFIAGMTETYGGNPEKTTRVDSLWDGISKYIRNPANRNHRLHIPRSEALKALDEYLVSVDFRFPRLPVAKVRSGIEAITATEDSEYRKMYAKNPAHVFMAYMVIAIVPLISDSYPISQGSFVSIHVLAKCMTVLDRVFSLEDGVDIIQCLHLLVIFSIHCSAAGSAWHLIGLALSKCIALGYHRENSSTPTDVEELEEMEQRRWVFWGCYLLDRLLCAALGRPYTIDDRYITVALPGAGERNGASLLGADALHVHLFRYAQLLSDGGKSSTHRSFEDSLSQLLHWRVTTPVSDGEELKQAQLYQTSLYHTLMLRLAINDINSAYSFGANLNIETGIYVGHPDGAQNLHSPNHSVEAEIHRIKQVKLMAICRAVSNSLNRRHMAGRHYLSITTGYSALSVALVTIYGEYVNSIFSNRSDVRCDWDHMAASDILDIASQKLDIVGRQFPRLHEYRSLVDRLRQLRDHLHLGAGHIETSTDWTSIKEAVINIGPPHLRLLGLAILFLARNYC